MKKLLDFLKGVFRGLLDILIIAAELLLCAIIVLFLVEHPISSPKTTRVINIQGGEEPPEPRKISPPDPVPAFLLPDVDWVPPAWGPARYWGYHDKYSFTQLRGLPGYWKLANSPAPFIELSWWSPIVYYEVWNIPSLFTENF